MAGQVTRVWIQVRRVVFQIDACGSAGGIKNVYGYYYFVLRNQRVQDALHSWPGTTGGAYRETAAVPRLMVFANRVPTSDPPSGGLVVALESVLNATGGVWFGTESSAEAGRALMRSPGPGFECMAMPLSDEEHTGYYLGHANSVLWPLLHGRPDLADLRSGDLGCYQEVNARLAREAVTHIRTDDIIWIHDYHLIPLASQLRALGVRNPIGFFLHTPFADTSSIGVLSDLEEFLGWFADYDLVGLQTQRDVANFLSVYRKMGAAELISNGRLRWKGRSICVGSFPIGIDAVRFQEVAKTEAEAERFVLLPHRIMVGVDRLDYTKGIPQRLKGFQMYLRNYRSVSDRISFIQIAPPTREDLHAYQDTRRELEQLSGEVNGEFSDIGYVPVHYIHRAIHRNVIAGLLRRADIALITSLNDGMNLVAKEFVAAQPENDPGVLILSRFAGAAEQLEAGALLVNPYDPVAIGEAIRQAVAMTLEERRLRHQIMMDVLRDQDDRWWAKTYLEALLTAAKQRFCDESALL